MSKKMKVSLEVSKDALRAALEAACEKRDITFEENAMIKQWHASEPGDFVVKSHQIRGTGYGDIGFVETDTGMKAVYDGDIYGEAAEFLEEVQLGSAVEFVKQQAESNGWLAENVTEDEDSVYIDLGTSTGGF